MSYEGFEEYICPNGHYYTADATTLTYCDPHIHDKLIKCPVCQLEPEFTNSVDETNGVIESSPFTMPGKKEEIGFDDIWHIDHYGNKYATKAFKYKPIGWATYTPIPL